MSHATGNKPQFEYNPLDPDDKLYGSQLNESGLIPQGYKLLLEPSLPADLARALESGLEIPQAVKERYESATVVAKVIQVGKDCYRPEQYPGGPWCFPGDYVVMMAYSGTRLYSNITKKNYRAVNEDTIEVTVIDPSVVERGQ